MGVNYMLEKIIQKQALEIFDYIYNHNLFDHQNKFLQSGQVEFWLVENHLYKQAEWNFFLHVGHATLGI